MTMDPKIACIGAGYWGKNLVRDFHALGRLSCVCGNRIDFEGEERQGRCRDCGRTYRKVGRRVTLRGGCS
jgi:Zn finger protein HypA/HybF involved in hydrogenase expression